MIKCFPISVEQSKAIKRFIGRRILTYAHNTHMKESLVSVRTHLQRLENGSCERSPRDLRSPERTGNWMLMIGGNEVSMNSESHLLEAARS